MYVPEAFRQSELTVLHDFIERHSFGVLCSTSAGAPSASHVPLLLEREPAPLGTLLGHLARANPQWREADGQPVLVIFSGPHAYISPSWYQAEQMVPTWNYAAVHATGILRTIQEPEPLRDLVARMVQYYESPRAQPWQLEAGSEYVTKLLRGIVGFRIELTKLEGKWKLSQNQPQERPGVVNGLRQQGDADSLGVAELMDPRSE
jgi:transcriptional regulator